ncbi:MAG: hypothetical protein U5N85_05035 [Arcicella sp.]|nr:hypothetical protein [Arcicella sp.]
MKQLIETTFPCQTGNCIETRNETIFWIDEYSTKEPIPVEIRGKSFILLETDDDRLFTVNNPSQKEITFIAIDAGIFTDNAPKCDFALFDNQRFCFVECKDSVKKQRSKERKSAFIQLKTTIIRFKENLDFGSYKIEAQVSMKAQMVFPRKSCSREDMVKEFEDELAVTLFENNEIEF